MLDCFYDICFSDLPLVKIMSFDSYILIFPSEVCYLFIISILGRFRTESFPMYEIMSPINIDKFNFRRASVPNKVEKP